jgi:ABC-type multidrug transport system fused ATPase/permease subunit
MGAIWKLFLILALFCFAACAGYILWGLWDPTYGDASEMGRWEFVGVIGLALVGALCSLITFYLFRLHRAQGGELPEDRNDALIDDGEAEQGFFSPWSWWPVSLGASAALMFTGLAVGNWICFIAVPLAAISVVGLIFEYQRGYFGH